MEIKKYKDTIIICPHCGNKVQISLPSMLGEYHEDMFISPEMEYKERKKLEKAVAESLDILENIQFLTTPIGQVVNLNERINELDKVISILKGAVNDR